MKILVIFTGGTIGSAAAGGKISPDGNAKYRLLDGYLSGDSHGDVEFESYSPYTILSENLAAENLNTLIDCVKGNLKKGYDGIIVAHGTDTLQYTAAALLYTVGNANVPIILVSSNYVLTDPRANGNINFEAAVQFIRQKLYGGVFISYTNEGEYTKFHRPDFALAHMETCDEVRSINGNYFARYTGGVVELNENFCDRAVEVVEDVVFTDRSEILVIDAYPAANYDYNIESYRAVIFRPCHSGTLSTADKKLADFCKRARACNLPLFVVDVPSGDRYESTSLYGDMGITVLAETPFADAYVRAWMAISLGVSVRRFLPAR